MRRWSRAECPKLAHEVRLVGVAIGVGEFCPSERRSHRGALPGSRESSEPLEALRSRADGRHESSVKMPGRHAKVSRKADHGQRIFSAEQPIHGADDEPVGAA